jgi:hypothetical protein
MSTHTISPCREIKRPFLGYIGHVICEIGFRHQKRSGKPVAEGLDSLRGASESLLREAYSGVFQQDMSILMKQ